MDDNSIIKLYFDRDPDAVKETSLKYGNYCRRIAKNILERDADVDECVNDAYLKMWNSIPPNRPRILSAYLAKIVRNLSFDAYKRYHADKRGSGEIVAVLDELSECVSGSDSVEQEIDRKELVNAINIFLSSLPKDKCRIFIYRYWYTLSIAEIAGKTGKTSGNISVILSRIRTKLKDYLTERGFDL